MTDKPYQGRRGGRYVRTSHDEEPRRVDQATVSGEKPLAQDDKGGDATPIETASAAKQTAGKPARKRN